MARSKVIARERERERDRERERESVHLTLWQTDPIVTVKKLDNVLCKLYLLLKNKRKARGKPLLSHAGQKTKIAKKQKLASKQKLTLVPKKWRDTEEEFSTLERLFLGF